MEIGKFNLEKNFKWYFALFITASTFAFDIMLFYVEAPEHNRDIINMIAGVLNTGCLITVVNYFYSSTASSQERSKQITEMLSKKEIPTIPSVSEITSLASITNTANTSSSSSTELNP